MGKKKKSDSEILSETIVRAIQEKKGNDIISLNLSKIPNAVSNYFILCHGASKVQVEAIADSVVEEVSKTGGGKPWHREGFENAEWILLDYVDVVVHIFQEHTRLFYNLEGLWADAVKTEFNN
ncbi:MAG: ribosome silencing factor [Bacteroidales bacterium]|nr:ribosome silencing factor [Bacteroidales bacterium]